MSTSPPPTSPTKEQIVFTIVFIALLLLLLIANVVGILLKQDQIQAIITVFTAIAALLFAAMQVFAWMAKALKKIWIWIVVLILLATTVTGIFYYGGILHHVDYTKLSPRALYTLAFNNREPDVSSNLQNDIDNWDVANYPSGDGCNFKDHYEFVVTTRDSVIPCFQKNIDTVDFAVQVNMQVVQGNGGGGFVLRSGGNTIDYPMYRYDINPAAQTFDFLVQHNNSSRFNPDCDDFGNYYCYVSTISKTGVNTLAVIVIGPLFYLYINGSHVGTIHNESYVRGSIGLFAVNHHIPTTVRFDSFQFWYLNS
jgi:hypothetical protein